MTNKIINLQFSVKDIDEAGEFSGYASRFNNVDLQGDRVLPGAFAKSLAASRGRVPLLSQHDPAQSIGLVDATEDQRGLRVRGKLVLTLPKARDEYERLKAGLLNAMSIGYETTRDRITNGVREIVEASLWEVSLVTFPANPLARVESVKNQTAEDSVLRELRTLAASVDETMTMVKFDQVGARIARLQSIVERRSE